MKIESLILEAIREKKIFIGVHMLCRYLNGRGYKRYGCNTQYNFPYNPNDKINPCPILCPSTQIYPSKIQYWIKKLGQEKKIFSEAKHYILDYSDFKELRKIYDESFPYEEFKPKLNYLKDV